MSAPNPTPTATPKPIVLDNDIAIKVHRRLGHEEPNLALPKSQQPNETPEQRAQRIRKELEAWCQENLTKKAFPTDDDYTNYFELLYEIRIAWRLDLTNPDGPASMFFKERKSVLSPEILDLFDRLAGKFERYLAGAVMLSLYQAWAAKTARVPKALKFQIVLNPGDVEAWFRELGLDLDSEEAVISVEDDRDIPFRVVPCKPFHVAKPKAKKAAYRVAKPKKPAKKTKAVVEVEKKVVPRRDSDLEAHIAGYRTTAPDMKTRVEKEKAAGSPPPQVPQGAAGVNGEQSMALENALGEPSNNAGAIGEQLMVPEKILGEPPNAKQTDSALDHPGQVLPDADGGHEPTLMKAMEQFQDAGQVPAAALECFVNIAGGTGAEGLAPPKEVSEQLSTNTNQVSPTVAASHKEAVNTGNEDSTPSMATGPSEPISAADQASLSAFASDKEIDDAWSDFLKAPEQPHGPRSPGIVGSQDWLNAGDAGHESRFLEMALGMEGPLGESSTVPKDATTTPACDMGWLSTAGNDNVRWDFGPVNNTEQVSDAASPLPSDSLPGPPEKTSIDQLMDTYMADNWGDLVE
ncbi:hypothetical protein MMC10_005056 [Thelotrema lepadinum]|nr:hypothetical protein [Thelotrema lepadinum]